MDTSNNTTISKLVLLYIFDNMEIPLTEKSIIDICCREDRNWISYITCKEVLADLIETGFVLETGNEKEKYYSITADGRSCLSYFFTKIPTSLREEILAFIKENRLNYRRRQEYDKDYYKNADGTYTVVVKIVDPLGSKLELKLNVANRAVAKQINKRWEEKASEVYASIYDILID
ncbi:MAG: DUF4364 family protein [Clostridia bacterium]|nr:DUF4364 family protein [Clostridia bacterium]